tara:strand:- start:257769 stop:258998 length:1230 start_codon:yes stop_codon:yes gene_type:complete
VGTHLKSSTRRILVLGSTGSIGVQTLQAIQHLNTLHDQGRSSIQFQVVGLSAGCNHKLLCQQAEQFGVTNIALSKIPSGFDQSGYNIRVGDNAPTRLVQEIQCDLVVGAIVGIAGLGSVLRAVELGTDVALANKESLVAAGELVMNAARQSGAAILPLDSEHAGVWQCLQSVSDKHYCPPAHAPSCIDRVVLTASGGPFREKSRDQIHHAKLDDALKHPNWSMGAKVTIDSATLMNKALELIEAHWLFDLSADKLGAVIHPQSTVHALIETCDSSVIAQLGAPDMRAPIQHALCSPQRMTGCAEKLDVTKLGCLDFIEVDPARFPAIGLAMQAISSGGNAGAVLNAANEQAVNAFMNGQLEFGMIDQSVVQVLNEFTIEPIHTIEDVYAADAHARQLMDRMCSIKAGGR